MAHVSLALVGFGNVGRAFARLLLDVRERLSGDYDLEWSVTGIATHRHGTAINELGLDLDAALDASGGSLGRLHCCPAVTDASDFIRSVEADVMVETTVLDVRTGGAAVEHIRTALESGTHVITANKGPVACAYRELADLARARGLAFRFESAVMDGTPIVNLVERTLPGCRIRGFRAVLNSTTNVILTTMEAGGSFDAALGEAKRRGIAEADTDHDIDGLDAAAKTAVLVNVLMGGNVSPVDIPTRGIRDVSPADLAGARANGRHLRLVASAAHGQSGVEASVRLEALADDDPLARLRGSSNAIVLRTDLMGDLTIIEHDPGVAQTAYGLLADLVAVVDAHRASFER